MVKIAIALAGMAFFLAVGIFLWPGVFTEETSWRASVGGTLTTAIALILGAIALIITARVESSDYRAQEATKSDIASLLATLALIQSKGALWRTQQVTTVDYRDEAARIAGFANSTTGFAMYNMAAKKSREAGKRAEEWRVFFLYLSEIVCSPDNPGLVLNRAIRVQELLLKLNKGDLNDIGKSVSDLVTGIANFEKALDDNVLIKAMRELTEKQAREEGGGTQMQGDIVKRKFQYLKDQGVDDPNIDMFLAVFDGDQDKLKKAIESGAEVNMTDSALLRKYADKLKNFTA